MVSSRKWFAWRPVPLGYFRYGYVHRAWLRFVWRNTTATGYVYYTTAKLLEKSNAKP